MIEITPNLKMELETGTDYYNIGKFNEKFRQVDGFAGSMKSLLESLTAEQIAYLNSAMTDVSDIKAALDWLSLNKANKDEPLKYSLPLCESFREYNVGSCFYQRGECGLISLSFEIARDNDAYFSSPMLSIPFMLPKGFGPVSMIRFVGIGFSTLNNGLTPTDTGSAVICYIPPSAIDGSGCRIIVPANIKLVMGSTSFYTTQ